MIKNILYLSIVFFVLSLLLNLSTCFFKSKNQYDNKYQYIIDSFNLIVDNKNKDIKKIKLQTEQAIKTVVFYKKQITLQSNANIVYRDSIRQLKDSAAKIYIVNRFDSSFRKVAYFVANCDSVKIIDSLKNFVIKSQDSAIVLQDSTIKKLDTVVNSYQYMQEISKSQILHLSKQIKNNKIKAWFYKIGISISVLVGAGGLIYGLAK